MGFINMNLGDTVKEGEIVAEGRYQLRITKADDTESKKGNPMTRIVIRIEDAPTANALPIFYYMNHIYAGLSDDQVQMRSLEIKRFLTLFGVPFEQGGFDTQDLVGQTAEAFVGQEEGEDKIMRNRLVLPRLKD